MSVSNAFVIGWPSITESGRMTVEAAKRRFEGVRYVPINEASIEVTGEMTRVFYRGVDLSEFDVCFPRISISYAEWGYNICKVLAKNPIYLPYSPDTVLWAHNKFTTIELLKRAKIPVPDTYLAKTTGVAKKIIEKLNFPIVVKLIGGAGGKGVMYLESEASANALLDTLETLKQLLFIEEFIPNRGEDIRAFVIGDDVTSYKRVAGKGERRANLHSGGKGVKYIVTDEEKEMALRSARALKADICGVDIIQREDGTPFVLEVNVSPGLNGISSVTGKNMAERIVDYSYDKVKR